MDTGKGDIFKPFLLMLAVLIGWVFSWAFVSIVHIYVDMDNNQMTALGIVVGFTVGYQMLDLFGLIER